VIHERKLAFTPDDSFLRYYPFEAVRDALDLATPLKTQPMTAKHAPSLGSFFWRGGTHSK
jgi:hypothetical protein